MCIFYTEYCSWLLINFFSVFRFVIHSKSQDQWVVHFFHFPDNEWGCLLDYHKDDCLCVLVGHSSRKLKLFVKWENLLIINLLPQEWDFLKGLSLWRMKEEVTKSSSFLWVFKTTFLSRKIISSLILMIQLIFHVYTHMLVGAAKSVKY